MWFSTGKELKFGWQHNLWPTISWSQQLPLPDGCSLGWFYLCHFLHCSFFCFQYQIASQHKNGFKVGMKLEGIDPQHPSMYFILTVAEVSHLWVL